LGWRSDFRIIPPGGLGGLELPGGAGTSLLAHASRFKKYQEKLEREKAEK
jgi:hypothetical protein